MAESVVEVSLCRAKDMKNSAGRRAKCRNVTCYKVYSSLDRTASFVAFAVAVAVAHGTCSLLHCNLNHILPATAEHVIFGQTSCKLGQARQGRQDVQDI